MVARAIILTDVDRRRLGSLLADEFVRKTACVEYIFALEDELEEAQAFEVHQIPAHVVTMNSAVTVRDLDTGELKTYRLVYPEDADADARHVSVLSALGMALLGKQIDDVIEAKLLGERKSMVVERICFQPEAEGRYDL
jgi:regulator of nucleoside diphosphate kinase